MPGYMRATSRAAQRDVATIAAARRSTSPSRLTLNCSDHRSRELVASCRTQVCVQSSDTIAGRFSIRSRLAYAVACR
jgi:hypothetical protein